MATFENVKKNFGFGCMRFPRKGPLIDNKQVCEMVDAFMEECLKLREQNGLEKINAILNPEYQDSSVKSLPKLKDDDILTDSTKHLFYTCE
jgi:hypothetical protein